MRINKTKSTSPISNHATHLSSHHIFPFYDVPFANFFTVLVFHPRVLADGVGINLVPLLVVIHKLNDHAYAIVVLEQATFYSYSIVKALASEFNFSHSILFYS